MKVELSDIVLHVIVGEGIPDTLQTNVKSLGAVMFKSLGGTTITAGTVYACVYVCVHACVCVCVCVRVCVCV